jgi:hypothetical protein
MIVVSMMAVVSIFVFMAPMEIPPMFMASMMIVASMIVGRDLDQRSMLQLSMTLQIRLPAK